MKTSTFNRIFENARTVNIQSNEWFNYAGFFWMQCTEKQLAQMRMLLKAQNCKTTMKNGEEWYILNSGMLIKIHYGGFTMSENTKKIRCAAVITNDLGQLLVLQQGDTYRLPSREIEYTQSTNECIEAALREVQESCQIRGVQVDVATGLLELDPEKSLLLVFGWVTETPELPPSSTPDSEPHPVWLAKKKEQQLAANLWNIYSHPTDLALSIALMQCSQLDMMNAR